MGLIFIDGEWIEFPDPTPDEVEAMLRLIRDQGTPDTLFGRPLIVTDEQQPFLEKVIR